MVSGETRAVVIEENGLNSTERTIRSLLSITTAQMVPCVTRQFQVTKGYQVLPSSSRCDKTVFDVPSVYYRVTLPGFGNGWLKYCATVQLWGKQWNILIGVSFDHSFTVPPA